MAVSHSKDEKEGNTTEAGGCGSIFFITLTENATYLDGKHAPFGKIVEDDSFETLKKFNTSQVLTDDSGKPLRDIRIRHVVVLDDPFPDPEGLIVPPNSPAPTAAQLKSLTVGEDEELLDDGREGDEDEEIARQKEKVRRDREARSQALTLEMIGDLPFADVAPPENVLFVCKLNAVTRSEDLELIFSRFGEIMSCEVIRDKKSGDSLNYAFIEFKEKEDAERAYVKMDNVLIDDRRIHVDFSQSVSKLHDTWVFDRTGGRPPPNKGGGGGRNGHSNGGGRKRSRSPDQRRHNANGKRDDGLLFDTDDYQYKDRSRVQKTDGGRRDRDRDDREGKRRRSRSRERSPRRDSHKSPGADREGDRYRERPASPAPGAPPAAGSTSSLKSSVSKSSAANANGTRRSSLW